MRRPTRVWTLLVLQLALAVSRSAEAQKTDTVVFVNGDSITVEIKRLDRGRLDASTDGMGTVSIEWKDVAHLTSPSVFEVMLDSGERYFGTLARSDIPGEIVVDQPPRRTLRRERIVRIKPNNASFWQQWDGSIDVGYNFTKAGESTQWSVSSIIRRQAEAVDTTISGSSFFSSKSGADDTSRHTLSATVQRMIGQRWGVRGVGQLQSNDELNLRVRSQGGGAWDYRVVQTGALAFTVLIGGVANREEYVDATPGQNTFETAIGIDFQVYTFDAPETDISTTFVTFSDVTTRGRTRLELDVKVRQELGKDFYFSVTVNDSFDSKPPSEGAARNDVNVVTSLGWSF